MVEIESNKLAVTEQHPTTESAYQQYAPELRYWLLQRIRDANQVDDLLQATFLKLNEHIGSIDKRAIRAWLYRVAINQSNLWGRKQQLENRSWNFLLHHGDFTSESPEKLLLKKELVEQTRLVLDRLPEKQRVIVRLKFYQGLTFAEIAEELRAPLGTVLSRMRAAMKSLEQIFVRDNLMDH